MDRRLLVLALGMFALGTDSFVVAGILPQVSHSFRVSIGAAGQLTTVYALVYALLSPTIAAVAAGVARKKLMITALAIFVIANLATAFAPNFGFALAMRAFAGLGAAMFAPTASGSAAALVPPERRGFALSVVVAGLTGATALGAPIGAMIGGFGDWRWTMVFVSVIGTAASIGVATLLPELPLPPQITLGQRLAPIADRRVALTLLTTLMAQSANFIVYTYFAVVFDRAIGGHTGVLGLALVLWGSAGTIANLTSGRLIDRLGTRPVLVTMLALLVLDMALLPLTSAHLVTALPALIIWGAFGWGILVPQQHRLVTQAPTIAPVVLGLNVAATYLGVTFAGLIGAGGLQLVGAHRLGFASALFFALALILSELSSQAIARRKASCRPAMVTA